MAAMSPSGAAGSLATGMLVLGSATGCLQTLSVAGNSGTAGTTSSSGTSGGIAATASSSGSSSASTGSSSSGGRIECHGALDGTACQLPDGGLAACYGETCQDIDLLTDPHNCGDFGVSCPPPTTCIDGECFEPGAGGITCNDGLTTCGAGQICIPFLGCEWTSCQPSLEDQRCQLDAEICTPGWCATDGFCCHDSCFNPFGDDPLNCGDCDVACTDGGICVQGQCEIPDPSCGPKNNDHLCLTSSGGPGSCCRSACVDSQSDPLNCGFCGIICPLGASCLDGYCVNDAGGRTGCDGPAGPFCPPGSGCTWELFVSECYSSSCAPSSDGIVCLLDGGGLAPCCGGKCTPEIGDGGCRD